MLVSGEGVGCQPQTSVPSTGIQWVSGPEISQSLNEREKVSLSSWPCLGSVGSGLIPQALVLPVPLDQWFLTCGSPSLGGRSHIRYLHDHSKQRQNYSYEIVTK